MVRKKFTQLLSGLVICSLLLTKSAFSQEGEKPTSIPEAARWVLSELPEDTALDVARMPKEGLIQLHMGLGMWIRNNVPVWGNEKLLKNVRRHPDDVGMMILEEFWKLSRSKLPEGEAKRIEFFEETLPTLKGRAVTAKTREGVIQELNGQIVESWPKEAEFTPFTLRADSDTHFNWEPNDMKDDLSANVRRFLCYHRSLPFYEGEFLRVGKRPEAKKQASDNEKQ